MTRLVHALLVLASISPACLASGYLGDMAQAWADASIVILGMPEAALDPDQETDRSRGLYAMPIEKVYKGARKKARIEFLDPHFRSTASLHIQDGARYLVFLQTSEDRKSQPHPSHAGLGEALSGLRVFRTDDKNLQEIEAGIATIREYERLPPDDRKTFLLQKLHVTNAYVHTMIVREVLRARIREAIPYFQQRLSHATDEADRLDLLGNLRCLGEPSVKPTLLTWLTDDSFKKKAEIIEEMVRLGDKSVIPEIRKYVNVKDEHMAVRARSAILRFGELDAKGLLLDMVQQSTDPIVRYNAIHALNWNYSGSFTAGEKTVIQALVQDEDQSIARVAGFIAKKWKTMSKKPGAGDGL